jgi:hypothetical protein
MAQPTTKAEFKEFCLRKLGKPVIEINVDPDQVDDRIDEALSYYNDYHFDGVEKTYFKHKVSNSALKLTTSTAENFTVGEVITGAGGAKAVILAASGAEITYSKPTNDVAFVHGEVITGEDSTTTATIESSANSGITKGIFELGYIEIPDNIIGAVNVFTPESNVGMGSGIFNAKYQFILHNLHEIVNYNMTHFYMSMANISLLEDMLVGAVPIRYNRHTNKLFLDTNLNSLTVGTHVVIEAYQVVDGATYTDLWKDRFLQNYATAKIKYQWGSNLTKFNGMTLPGGVQFNGEQILSDAREEIQRLEEEMASSYSLPAVDMIG